MKINNLKGYLEENNIKPSYPRLKILEYLMKYRNHPTADQIYGELVKEMPTLSKTTVYNTLNRFIEGNVAISLSIDNNETHYDATVKDHGHFKCEKCEKIYDFELDMENVKEKGLEGFKINSRGIFYKGICPECINKN